MEEEDNNNIKNIVTYIYMSVRMHRQIQIEIDFKNRGVASINNLSASRLLVNFVTLWVRFPTSMPLYPLTYFSICISFIQHCHCAFINKHEAQRMK